MTISPNNSLRELAFIVCTALDRAGTRAVLTGGGAATIYSLEAYQSRDLDYVVTFAATGSETVLLDLGFQREHQHYSNPQTLYTLDFPPGPLMIGDD